VAPFSASAAVAIAGNATAAHCGGSERGGNSSARPIDVTNGRTLADDCIGCARANDRECAPEIAAAEDGAGVRGFHRRPHTKRTQDLRSERNMRIVRIIESAAYFQRLN